MKTCHRRLLSSDGMVFIGLAFLFWEALMLSITTYSRDLRVAENLPWAASTEPTSSHTKYRVKLAGPWVANMSSNDEHDYGEWRITSKVDSVGRPIVEAFTGGSSDPDRIRREIEQRSMELFDPAKCQDPPWTQKLAPNCNIFHAIDLDPLLVSRPEDVYRASFLYYGMHRDAFLLEEESEDFVLKMLVAHKPIDAERILRVQREAMFMERLSSSPRIVDIWGHCAGSVVVERGVDIYEIIIPWGHEAQIEQEDLDHMQGDGVHPINNLTVNEKLDMALSMAEAIADMHGFQDGVLVNFDIFPNQWIRTMKDSKLKLNDFNLGRPLKWNMAAEKYCDLPPYSRGRQRSPEEISGRRCNEKVDVWAMGNVLFGLLTGLWPFYYDDYGESVKKRIANGEISYIDSRYRN